MLGLPLRLLVSVAQTIVSRKEPFTHGLLGSRSDGQGRNVVEVGAVVSGQLEELSRGSDVGQVEAIEVASYAHLRGAMEDGAAGSEGGGGFA